jgi:acyl-CoA reductase-like NAD-dependent aldehyde dehydrogenase
MRHRRACSAVQMGLFHPRVTIPQWKDLPAEVRKQTLTLLARLLRHRRDQLAERLDQKVRDE